jgi:hypothetical protein
LNADLLLSSEDIIVLIGKGEQISYEDYSFSHNAIWFRKAAPEGK